MNTSCVGAGDFELHANVPFRDEPFGAIGPLDQGNCVGGKVLLQPEEIDLLRETHSIEIDVYESPRTGALYRKLRELVRDHQGEARAHHPVGNTKGAGDGPNE